MSRYSITIKALFVIVIVGTERAEPEPAARSCGTGEWACPGHMNQNLTCIKLNKYCDGVSQCPDGADEPAGCTNCNRTYTGKAGVKFPLRVSGPFQRYLPFVCRLNFVAKGGNFGDFVELTFLSFNIGRLELTRKSTSSCKRGFMKIVEPNTETPSQEELDFGNFCGTLTERSATYYSRSSNVSVLVNVPSRSSTPSTSTFILFLTFRFLGGRPQKTLMEETGRRVPGTFCDRIFEDCHLRRCMIRNPNFPGIYPRNVTCNFYIKQITIPPGKVAHIVLSQNDDYKIFIPRGQESGSSNSPKNAGSSLLSTDCSSDASDSLKVIDGSSTTSPLLSQFCGDGTMPKIVSSGNELLVQLYSAPSQILTRSRMELEASVEFEPEFSSQMQQDETKCSFIIDARRHRKWGVVRSPKYTMPRNSSCTYTFIGSTSYDRIWMYFVSYVSRVKNSATANSGECVFSKLELFDSHGSWSQMGLDEHFSSYPLTFCGDRNVPRICAHAADYPPSYVPDRPCNFLKESYVSSGSDFTVRHTFLKQLDTADVFSTSSFVARYEFVDTRQDGAAFDHSECNRRFDSRVSSVGYFSNSKNVFLYGRGGKKNLRCVFHFVGLPSERLRITILKLRLSLEPSELNCETKFDPVRQRFECVTSIPEPIRSASIDVTEYWNRRSSPIGCVCNETSQERRTRFVFDSLVNNIEMVFTSTQMTALEDFNDFSFDAKYEFFNYTVCNTQVIDGHTGINREGMIEFQVPNKFSNATNVKWPLRCRWQVEALSQKYLYIQFKGLDVSPDQCHRGLWVLVYIDTQSKPTASACITSNVSQPSRAKEYHVFSQSWYNDTLSRSDSHKDCLFIEVIATQESVDTTIYLHWLEVTKPYYKSMSGRPLRNVDCLFECPEIGACIDPHLWCDGTAHCPSGYDELPDNCRTFGSGLTYLSLMVCFASVVLTVAVVLIFWVVFKHRSQFNGGSKRRTKGGHRLTPTEDYQMESPLS